MSLAWYKNLFGVEAPLYSPEGYNVPSQPGYVQGSGRLYTTTLFPTGSGVVVANIAYYNHIQVARQVTLDALVFNVTAGGAGNATLGIYLCDSSGLPSQLVAQCTAVSTATGGVKVCTFTTGGNITLIPGWYCLAAVFNGTPTVTGGTSAVQLTLLGHFTFPTGANGAYSAPLTYGALPAIAPAPTGLSAICVNIAMRAV